MYKIWEWFGPFEHLGFFVKKNNSDEHIIFKHYREADKYAKTQVNNNYRIIDLDVFPAVIKEDDGDISGIILDMDDRLPDDMKEYFKGLFGK